MKLSDIKGERTLEVVADCIEPIANIASDPEASRLFRREKLPEGEPANNFLLERAKASVPPLLKGHKADVIAILASIGGVTPEEYTEALNMATLIRDMVDLLTDEVFLGLFISPQSKTGKKPSGSARGNTKAQKA